MGKAKWVQIDSVEEPLDAVARRVLRTRLDLVWRRLESSIRPVHKAVEEVHQLRVATRRAVAAMIIFEAMLPRRRARWINKQLKRIRRAAGNARDLDVFVHRLLGLAHEKPEGPYRVLICQVEARRQAAQRPIEKIYRRLSNEDFENRVRQLEERVRLRSPSDKAQHTTFDAAARASVKPLVADLMAAASRDPRDFAELHALRIQAKELRYTMEVFAAAFDEGFREELYGEVEELQRRLGEINDHATACQHLTEWFDGNAKHEGAVHDAVREMIDEEETAMHRSRDDFFEWWTPERRKNLQQAFVERLADPTEANGQPATATAASADKLKR